MLKEAILTVLLAIITSSSVGQTLGGNYPSGPMNRAIFKADTSSPGATIPADFVGFSFEVGGTAGLLSGWFTGTATSLSGLLGKIPSCNLRFGGSTSDLIVPPNLTQAIVDNLASFITNTCTSYTIFYGLDITANDSVTANTQATMLQTKFGTNLILQMGNEPGQGASPNYNLATYETRWNTYYTAITGTNPTAKFAAIDGSNFAQLQTVITALTPGIAGMSFVTMHYYEMSNPPGLGSTYYSNIFFPDLNSAFTGTNCLSFLCLFSFNSSYAGAVRQRMTETGIGSGGGISGVSDRMMSATWLLGYSAQLINSGWGGFNQHSDGGGSAYSPLVFDGGSVWTARPIYSAMYMLAQIEGQQILPVTKTGSAANAVSFATQRVAGKANIIIVNQDINTYLTATPDQAAAWSTATSLLLSGASCTDSTVTLGGASIGAGGVWSGTAVTINKGTAVAIPPCGAALIEIQ